MQLTETFIKDLYVIDYKSFEDLRGSLLKPFAANVYAEKQLNLNIKEVWFTKSHLNVIRAMHYQAGEKACEKIVSVIAGKVQDVILDLRPDSATFGKYFEIILDAANPQALYIPKDCAHGYKVLSEDSIVVYMATELHSAKDDIGIRWDSFGYDWRITNPILSERDKTLPSLNDWMAKV